MRKIKIASRARKGAGEATVVAGSAIGPHIGRSASPDSIVGRTRIGLAAVLLAGLVLPVSALPAQAGNPWRGVYDPTNAAPLAPETVENDLYPPLEEDPIDSPPVAPAGPLGLAPLVPPEALDEFPPLGGDDDTAAIAEPGPTAAVGDAPNAAAPESAAANATAPTAADASTETPPAAASGSALTNPMPPQPASPAAMAMPAPGGWGVPIPPGSMMPGYWPAPGAYPGPGGHPVAAGPVGYSARYMPAGHPGFARDARMPPSYPVPPGAYPAAGMAPSGTTTSGPSGTTTNGPSGTTTNRQ